MFHFLCIILRPCPNLHQMQLLVLQWTPWVFPFVCVLYTYFQPTRACQVGSRDGHGTFSALCSMSRSQHCGSNVECCAIGAPCLLLWLATLSQCCGSNVECWVIDAPCLLLWLATLSQHCGSNVECWAIDAPCLLLCSYGWIHCDNGGYSQSNLGANM